MGRYYFELLDGTYNDLGASIPDGCNKKTAIDIAKRWMSANGVETAHLSVNSMATGNVLDVIDVSYKKNEQNEKDIRRLLR
ncbi:hypothetical protein [Bacteroides pyogenes]|uniref:hypothetical protein n=1 Tax=Bacteroides pyogenes TaxID=310300 RepID=UPI002A9194EF|nr:hypothetical protein [Bacteroides pyogenes]MDY5433671.1 hypothetical protein [Bacteroides pyogenes]